MPPLSLALVGCGAITALYYRPLLLELEKHGRVRVTALVDPLPAQLEKLAAAFPRAVRLATVADLTPAVAAAAVVASPQRFHAQQTIGLLDAGLHVLCEKPMASTAAEAESMCEAARRTGRTLAVGHVRRFFPSSETIRDCITHRRLGRPLRFDWTEGGPFNWPAASASFFQKSGSAGGVFADHGAHCLDLLLWWFGVPEQFEYADDAMGGLEANCELKLRFADGPAGRLRLTRDTTVSNRLEIQCEHGRLRLNGVNAGEVVVTWPDAPHQLKSALGTSEVGRSWIPARTYEQSYIEQVIDFVEACQTGRAPRVPGGEGLKTQAWIERCYRERTLMEMPWLSEEERKKAETLSWESRE